VVPNERVGRPTLERVAAHAGVSRTTVSRVVNGWPSVAPQLRESVQRAVADLGYVPNLAARSLVTHRTDAIALVISVPAERTRTDEPFFAGILRGAAQELDSHGKHLVVVQPATAAAETDFARYAVAGHVDGVLSVSTRAGDPIRDELARHGVPVVCTGRADGSYVDVDNAGGAAAAVGHLLDTGRRRIATVTGPPDTVAGADRLDGYRSAMRTARRRPLVAAGDFTRDSGGRAVRALLDRAPDLDAVFCASDVMAMGALTALRAAGRRVPDDVAVVGFDDTEDGFFSTPSLTSISPGRGENARTPGRLLTGRDAGTAGGGPPGDRGGFQPGQRESPAPPP